MRKYIEIEMIQGYSETGTIITHVSKPYDFRKHIGGGFRPFGTVEKPIARFKVKFKRRMRWFFESEEQDKMIIENWLYYHLEIFNINYGL